MLKLVARIGCFAGSMWVRWYCSSSVASLKIRTIISVRMLDIIVCSGPLVWLFSPAWDTIKLALKFWFHLPFRGHWPYRLRSNNWYRLRSNNWSCSRTNDWHLPWYRIILKLACVRTITISSFLMFWFCTGAVMAILTGTKLHFKSPTAERRHMFCASELAGIEPTPARSGDIKIIVIIIYNCLLSKSFYQFT